MCGIAGGWWTEEKAPGNRAEIEKLMLSMGEKIAYRGPDGFGVWSDADIPLAMVHRRLAILDLSPAGHQPMLSDSGRFALSFNGEIYNFKDLKTELDSDIPWRGHSDTEIILRGIEKWGLERTLTKAVGMFAIALWDSQNKTLTLARDRMGEKPLYYECTHGRLLFSSELRAFEAIPQWSSPIDLDGLNAFFRHNYVPGPLSIFKNVKKLSPAHFIVFERQNLTTGVSPKPIAYWDLGETIERASQIPFVSDQEAVEEIHSLLSRSIQEKLVADVPVGLFLSGGIDSSLTTALAQASSSSPVRTFSIGFTDPAFDESPYARAVAEHLGTHHTEMIVTPEDAQRLITEIPSIYDEPFADSSQIPTVLLSRLTRQHVTVSLSGDAGDEIFGGYSRYIHYADLAKAHASGPRWAKRLISKSASILTEDSIKQLASPLELLHPRTATRFQNLARKIKKAAIALDGDSLDTIYTDLVTHWKKAPLSPSASISNPVLPLESLMRNARPKIDGPIERLMYLDSLTYLPDDILVKVDRATMSTSLEARAPFLDHRLIEAAWRLPTHLRVHQRRGKIVLRDLLGRYVPKALFERPKMGFGIPIDRWLGNELRDWCENYLSETALSHSGLLETKVIREKWLQHVSGKANWGYWLWDVIQFQAWYSAKKPFLGNFPSS